MGERKFNITKICQVEDVIELDTEEFDIWLEYCQSSTDEVTTPTASPSLFPTGYVVYFSMLIFGGIICNLLVAFTIFFRARLRTVPNTFMVSLAVADFLMATVAIPLRIVEMVNQNTSFIITSMLFPFIGISSIFSLSCVTLDRYIHIRNPLNYEKHMNKSRAMGIIACVWMFSMLQSCFFFVVKDSLSKEAIYNDVRLVVCFIFPAIFICVAYTKLFLIARSHARVIATTSVTIPSPDRPSQKKDFKILKIIALIVGTFIVCWFPFLLSVSIDLHSNELPSDDFYLFMNIAECFACSTCVLNPIIYGFLRRDLRISMRYVTKCQRESIEESESL